LYFLLTTWETAVDLLAANLLSPIVLAFLLGAVAGLIRSELELPDPVLKLLSIYLLLSIGLKGGVELSQASLARWAACSPRRPH
jgi:uncharacterized protein